MIPEKGKRYLLKYNFGYQYTDIGTYTGKEFTYSENPKRIEYSVKVKGGSILISENEIVECIDNPDEEALKERRNAERDRLEERLGGAK